MDAKTRHKTLKDAMDEIRASNPDIELRRELDFQLQQVRRAFGVLYREELPVYKQKEFAYGYIKPLMDFLEFLDEL